VTSAAQEPAEELLMRAEAMIEAADGDMDEGRIELAGRGYGLAQRLFRQIADEHPKWHSRHVKSRLGYCKKRIEKVVAKLLKDSPPSRPAAVAANTPDVIEELGEAQDEMAEVDDEELLNREIESTRDDLNTFNTEPDDTATPPPATAEADPATVPDETAEKKPSRLSKIVRPFRGLFARRKGGEKKSDAPAAVPDAAGEPTPVSEPAAEDSDQAEPEVRVAMANPDPISDPPEAEASGSADVVQPVPEAAIDSPAAPVVEADLLRVLLRAGETEKAKTLLIDALTAAPDNKDWRLLLGIAYCQNGEYDKAMRVTKALLREDRTNARAHVVLGTAYLAEGNVVVAKDQMQLAVDLDPKLGEAHYNLARIWVSVEPPDIPSARIHYERALALGEIPDTALEDLLR
jgi:tetratricopeptide (TPR) repeat protein